MDGEQAEDRAGVGGRDGRVALVSCVGADGTGASRSLDTIYQALGGRARYLVTSRASKPPARLAPYQEYAPADAPARGAVATPAKLA